jgi:arginyl-tRNA synthetase
MNIFTDFSARIAKALHSLNLTAQDGSALDFSRIAVEPPRDASHGDLACNAAMVLAKPLGMSPRAVAEKLVEALRGDRDIESLEIAGPGFINLRLAPVFWQPAMADRTRGPGRRSIWNMSRPTRPGRCMSAIAGARCSATRWRT